MSLPPPPHLITQSSGDAASAEIILLQLYTSADCFFSLLLYFWLSVLSREMADQMFSSGRKVQ